MPRHGAESAPVLGSFPERIVHCPHSSLSAPAEVVQSAVSGVALHRSLRHQHPSDLHPNGSLRTKIHTPLLQLQTRFQRLLPKTNRLTMPISSFLLASTLIMQMTTTVSL